MYKNLTGMKFGELSVIRNTYKSNERQEFLWECKCSCEKCCLKTDGITFIGEKATPHKTIAVDPSVIPIGTLVMIEGLGTFKAEDVGGAIKGNQIDMYFETHQEALNFGKKEMVVTHALRVAD